MKAGPIELEWERELLDAQVEVAPSNTDPIEINPEEGTLSTEFGELAKTSPLQAIIQAHARVEKELRRLLESAGAPPPLTTPAASLTKLARAALNRNIIAPQTFNALEGLSNLRDLAAVHPETATPERALAFLVTADTTLWAARQNARSKRVFAVGAAASR
jgi:hypothetical protein